MRLSVLFLALLAAGCGGGGNEAEPLANDAAHQAELMENMARDIAVEAENQTSAIEQAMENESQERARVIFESRNQLLNQVAENEAEPANSSR